MRTPVAFVALAASLCATGIAHAQPAAPPPTAQGGDAALTADRRLLAPEYPAPSARGSLALTGAAVLAVWYGAGAGASFLWPDAPGAEDLRIPVAGPWLSLRETGCPSRGECNQFTVVLRAVLTVMDGVGQLGGLLVLGEAAFLPTRAPVRASTPKPALRAAPFVAGADGVGVGVSGAF